MSILIKGMEMPKTCRKCGFYHHSVDDGYYDFEYCGANNKEFNNAYDSTKPHINPFEEKLSTCPLVPVPPHGRFGDLDALIDEVIAKYLEHERKGELVFAAAEVKQDIVDLISDAPTIIPAESEEEEMK